MMKKWWFVSFVLFIFLASCREPQGSLRGPVPAIGTPENALSSVLGNVEITSVSLADLLDDPGAYKDQFIRVTGDAGSVSQAAGTRRYRPKYGT